MTVPSEKDYRHPLVGRFVDKYMKGVADVPAENRMRILRLIESLTVGSGAACYLPESMHGAGSPQAQRIMIARQVNLGVKQRAAQRLCGIE